MTTLMDDPEYVGMIVTSDNKGATYFFHQKNGDKKATVITRTKNLMEDNYAKLVQPFQFFNNRIGAK